MTDMIERVNDESADEGDDEADATEHRRRIRLPQGWQGTTLAIAVMVAAAGGIPLAVALGVLHSPRWFPLLDLAQTELRVRDVASDNPPLVGLAGRIQVVINGETVRGSHPGPLSFYALWPVYALFGATAWALQVASAALNLLAMTAATWTAHRRGGLRLALGVAAGLAVLARAYGAGWLTEAWNPYMPMLWWVVFLLAVWSLLCHDFVLMPVAVFAGSFCMQTHVPYVGLVIGVGVVAFAAIVVWFFPRRNESKPRWYLFRWGAPSLAVATALWLLPIYEQFTRPRGNFWMIYESFSDPTEPRPGLRTAVEVWLANLNPLRLLSDHGAGTTAAVGSLSIPALVLLFAWAAAAVYAWQGKQRHGSNSHRDILRLHLVLAVALVLGIVSISRIHGTVWFYLVLWSWGTTMLMTVATTWTGVVWWRDRQAASAAATDTDADAHADAVAVAPGLTRWGTVALAGVLVVAGAAFTYDAAHTDIPAGTESRTLSMVAPLAVAELREDDVLGGGEDGRYLLTWDDSLSLGSQGYGFLLELEREGFDVGVLNFHSTGAVPHRVLPLEQATAQLSYVNGDANLARWEANPDAERLVYVDPRTRTERTQYTRLRQEVLDGMRDAGLPTDLNGDEIDDVDQNLFTLGTDPRLPQAVTDKIVAMMDLGLPTAVYVLPLP